MEERHLSTVTVAAVIVLVALAVLFDVTRRAIGRSGDATPPAASIAAADTTAAARTPSADSGKREAADSAAARGGEASQSGSGNQEPSYMELVARAETRRHIRASAGLTYLSEIIAASGDSMLHRWDDRVTRPVRVHFGRARAANYQPAFLEVIRSAFREWEDAVPVRFDTFADSANAEVHIVWKVQFEKDRTGQTDLSWNNDGHVQGGVITLATFDPEGQPMGMEEIRIVALHEIGHLIGLDHSSDSGDVMFPVASARRLSRRDVETARLLYRLAPGSLR
jgi:hypothetical protein